MKELQKTLICAWLDALRSGEWKQCRGALEKPGIGNCCLGVLCRVAMAHGVDLRLDQRGGETFFNGCNVMTPIRVQNALGMSGPEGSMGDYNTLAIYNDNGIDFRAIADIIEKNCESLFVNGAEVRRWLNEREAQDATPPPTA